jgi:putative DNA primase/helicase
MSDDIKVISFPALEEERTRRLRTLVEWRAGQPPVEWEMYLKDDAQKHEIAPAELRRLIQAVIKEREKNKREEQAIQRKHERKGQRDQQQTERQEREEEKRTERKKREEREAAAERRRVKREIEKRERALASIMAMPAAECETTLRALALQLGEDYAALHAEFETRVEAERERIRRGEVEPWPEPVETRALLNELTTQLQRYLVIHQPEAATAMALWTCFAWCHDIATFSPILVIQSADADGGKTTACKVVAMLTPRAQVIAEPTGPSFYRFVDRYHPTLICDDADQLLARRDDLAHIINTSWTKGTVIQRTDPRTGHVNQFDVFCPKVLSGIDLLAHLKPATRTRCITINLLPKLAHEQVTSFHDADDDKNFPTLRSKLLRWTTDNMATIKQAKPAMPKEYTNRLADNFRLMLAIAELAGGDWPKRARTAAIKLTPEERPSPGSRLLADMRDLFAKHGKMLASTQVVTLLVSNDEGEWANYRGRGPINKYEVAQLLRPYGVKPDVFSLRGQNVRGYKAEWFETAFTHYLPPRRSLGR